MTNTTPLAKLVNASKDETLMMHAREPWPTVRTRCNTIGCRELATVLVAVAERTDPTDSWTEQLCAECVESYSRRPALIVSAL